MELAAELERIGVTYGQVSAAEYIQLVDLGEIVWFKGPPARQLDWRGRRPEALQRLARIPDGSGPDGFWAEFAAAGSGS